MTRPEPAAPLIQHSLAQSLALHLAPGVIATAAFLVMVRLPGSSVLPPLFWLLLATALVLLPLELGLLVARARKAGSDSFWSVVSLRQPLRARDYFAWSLALVAWGFVSSALFSPVDSAVRVGLFSWLPQWFVTGGIESFSAYTPAAWWTTFALGIVVVPFAGPFVEELYFRGHLLPRMGRFGSWAPVWHTVLFSLYHVWTPWQNASRIALVLPLTLVVWRKQNLYLGMAAHMALNAIVWIVTVGYTIASKT